MRLLTAALLLVSTTILGFVLYHTNLVEVWAKIATLGWIGLLAVLVVYFVAFSFNVIAWQLSLPVVGAGPRWTYRLWKVRMAGAAVNGITPLASLGGEPVKAALLHHHFDVGYRDVTASLIIAQTVNTIALVIFLTIGFGLMFSVAALPSAYRQTAGAGLLVFSLSILGFFLAQWFRLLSRGGSWLSRLSRRSQKAPEMIEELEACLVGFYRHDRGRFFTAIAINLVNWVFGAIEVYLVLTLSGHAVSFHEAWVIEAATVLVRSALFVIPSAIGTQEGVLFLMCGAITGVPSVGVVLALVRRFREIVWIAWGLAIGWAFGRALGESAETNLLPSAMRRFR